MKRMLLLSVLLIVTTSEPMAQSGSIELSSSYYRHWCCYLNDNVPGIVKVYAHHAWSPGASGAKFRIYLYPGVNLTYLGEASPFTIVDGNPIYGGITIDYGACLATPVMILEIQFFASGLSVPCGLIQVGPSQDAASGEIEVLDCSEPPNVLYAPGGDMLVNPIGDCYCCGCECDQDPIPAEQSNWGRIKALYRDN